MIVRRAELSDIPAVAALERAEFPDGANEGMLARLWETDGGVILAAEDIGLANPNGLLLANACFDTVHKIGMPEARIPLAEATIYLATSPKSNSAYMAIDRAMGWRRRIPTTDPSPCTSATLRPN